MLVAQWELFGLDVRASKLKAAPLTFRLLEVDSNGLFIDDVSDLWPDPYSSLLNAIEHIEESGSRTYPSSFFDEAKKFVLENKMNLICSIPDFETLRSVYRLELKALDLEGAVDEETEKRIAEIVKRYEEKGELINIEKIDRTDQTSIARMLKKREIYMRYHHRMSTAKSACDRRGSDLLDKLLELKGARVL